MKNGSTMRRVIDCGGRILPRPLMRWIQRVRGRSSQHIPRGSVRFGDFKRLSPIGAEFGWERGTPVDRYYIEKFLARNADDIRGSVLELGDSRYTRRFGGERVKQSDILSFESDNSDATIIGDLTQPGTLPEAAFDCIVLTQVLQLIFDTRAAIDSLYRALKPGGVLLVTAPGISSMGYKIEKWSHVPWYWSLTANALRHILEDRWYPNSVSVESFGNILAATAFLYGLAAEELDISDIDVDDSTYPVIVAARAIKRQEA